MCANFVDCRATDLSQGPTGLNESHLVVAMSSDVRAADVYALLACAIVGLLAAVAAAVAAL